MPPRGVKSSKRARQYEHIKESAAKSGRSPATAKRIAAATLNKPGLRVQHAGGHLQVVRGECNVDVICRLS